MKGFYLKRFVCGKEQYMNQQTGQWQSAPTNEIYMRSNHEALLRAAAQAFPGALVYSNEVGEEVFGEC